MAYWLLKSEPDCYGWGDLVREGEGTWDGVKNAQAANNLKAMQPGDQAFFYHSRQGLEIVGIVTVSAGAFPDPGDASGRWVAVKVKPARALPRPVSLQQIKADPALSGMAILRQSRLSVAPVTDAEWQRVLELSAD
jgi:predicted RNA-binding protein with PUA-like domain